MSARPLTADEKHSIKLKQLGIAEYKPRAPETESQIMETMLGPLLPIYLSCIPNQVTSVKQLMQAPEHLKTLVRNPIHWPAVMKYILWRRENWMILDAHGVPRQ